MEGIYVVCMKNNVPLPDLFFSEGGNESSFDVVYNTMFSFQKWLSSIPLDQREEKILPIYISN